MKRLLLPALLLCLAPPAPAQDAAPPQDAARPRFGVDVRFGGVAFSRDCWDDDIGAAADFGLTVWEPSGHFGLWFGLGGQGASYEWEDDWGRLESDVLAVPFGASLLARLPLGGGVALRGEAGARYVAMDIDDWDDDYYDRHHRRYRDRERDRYYNPDRYLDVDDTALAVAALQLEFDFAPAPVRLAVGGGYQFDLRKPDVEYLHRPIGEVDLSGAFFFASFGVLF